MQELEQKAGQLNKEFARKLKKKLESFPKNAAALRNIVASHEGTASEQASRGSSLAKLLVNAETAGPRHVDFILPAVEGRDMIRYQKELSKYLTLQFGPDFVNEIALLQAESMDELKAQVSSMLDVMPGRLMDVEMSYLRKMTAAGIAGSLAAGAGVWYSVFFGSGAFAAAGALSATGAGMLIAVPLMGLASWYIKKKGNGRSKEECATRALDGLLQEFSGGIDKTRDNICEKFSKELDAVVKKLKDFRSQKLAPELAKMGEKSSAQKMRLESQLREVLQELTLKDPWLCGDKELEKIVKGTGLVGEQWAINSEVAAPGGSAQPQQPARALSADAAAGLLPTSIAELRSLPVRALNRYRT